MIEMIFSYSVLSDKDSICVFFISICNPESNLQMKNLEMFCLRSQEKMKFYTDLIRHINFGKKFQVRKKSNKKKLGYCNIENIDDPCFITIAVNPKEYFEKFESENVNKIYKGLRKVAKGMGFENYSRRINQIKEIETFGQLTQEKQKQNRFSIKNIETILEEIVNSKFAQINDKMYYFSNSIVSLPFSHPFLHEIVEFERNKKQNIQSFLQEGKHKLIQMEKYALEKNARISLDRSILQQKPTF